MYWEKQYKKSYKEHKTNVYQANAPTTVGP